MNVLEAITTRRSCRDFRPDPVPRKTLEELLDNCLRAPSWANSQPWQFAVAGGTELDKVKQALVERNTEGATRRPDIPGPNFSAIYQERTRDLAKELFNIMGISREDAERRLQWVLHGARFFGAPAGIIVYIDRGLGTYSVLDVGIMIQTIMLAAMEYGLATCPEFAVVAYPDILRDLLHIPESKEIVVGVAVGYADAEHSTYTYRSKRVPLDSIVTWHGFA